LEENPSGLSISEIARRTYMHRNTVSPNVNQLLEGDKLRYKMVGQAKVYYMSEAHSLHGGIKMDKEKNIYIGTGVSKIEDPFQAGKEAAEMALKGLNGKKPTISYIFFAGNYDPYKLNEGLMSVLNGTEFIGGSADAVFFDEDIIRNGVVIASIYSNYLHVGIASSDNVSSDPYEAARATTIDALGKLSIDKYLDPYLLFTRMRKGSVKWMLKIPSFYIHVFSRGMKLPAMGDETKIIKGVADEIGMNIPLWGGSFGSSLENLFGGKPYDIFAFHSGRVMKDGLVVVVNTCSLLYSQSIAHSCKRTDKFGFVSKVMSGGYVVSEISGEPAVDWYSKQLNMDKEEFLKNTMTITQRYPLGIPDNFGNFIIRGAGVHNEGTLAYVAPFVEGWPVYLMDADPNFLMKTSKEISDDIKHYTSEKGEPALGFAVLCASRRAILQDKLKYELKSLKENFNGAPIIGFSCFGEIGSKPGLPSCFQHMSSNVFTLYGKLLHEVTD
jgi:hypothetical protein